MQLLALALYSHTGARRDVRFRPGQLNIVSGESKTGKSALLTITEFCLGRSKNLIPAGGPISRTVAWFGSLWQLGDDPAGARAFVARPAPSPGRSSSQRAMLEFGDATLDLLDFTDLMQNSDTDSVRRQLGRRIGIAENVIESRQPGMSQTAFEAHLGHAVWLCLQDQDEIANRTMLFHRQGERGVGEHLRDTIPYFLGAVPADAAAKKAALRDAQRALRRAESAVLNAQREAAEADATLRGMLAEAHAAGLTDAHDLTDREAIVNVLRATRDRAVRSPAPIQEPPTDATVADGVSQEPAADDGVNDVEADGPDADGSALSDVEAQDRRRELLGRRNQLQEELDRVMENRALLLDHADGETAFTAAVALHAGRLTSLDLLPPPDAERPDAEAAAESALTVPTSDDAASTAHGHDTRQDDEVSCPVCGSRLAQPDPSATAIARRLSQLREQLAELTAAPASRRKARTDLETRAAELRLELSSAESALDALASAARTAATGRDDDDRLSATDAVAARNFTRGRIDALLRIVATADAESVRRGRLVVESARSRVSLLEAEQDTDADREQLQSRLNVVGRSMTRYAGALGLEHVADSVRLDLAQLTVVTDTDTGPIPLYRIGSAANWVGYHLATHLAMHRYFTENGRPVPRFLMLDQPTQAYYPSDARKKTGQPANDTDRAAVLAMFTVMRDVVAELAPRLQVIVCDHAYLEDDWFREAVVHNWRDGEKLVPIDWLAE